MQSISPAELEALLQDSGALLIDIRDEKEFSAGHIPGALLMPGGRIEPGVDKIANGKPVVFYCSSGMRTQQAAPRIDAAGLGESRFLQGGLNAWSSEQRETVGVGGQSQPVSIQRQVQMTVGVLLLVFAGLSLGGASWAPYLVMGVGLGLIAAGVTGSCAMAYALMQMPWNKRGE